jgi:hypothetical protein
VLTKKILLIWERGKGYRLLDLSQICECSQVLTKKILLIWERGKGYRLLDL